jgi:hypothetical protein
MIGIHGVVFAQEYAHAQEVAVGGKYDGRFDDLLFFFSYQYQLIQKHYQRNSEKAFHKKMRIGYVKKQK